MKVVGEESVYESHVQGLPLSGSTTRAPPLCENLLLVLGDGLGHGAAKRLCDAFITKGSNVELPVNTPIFLRLDSDATSVALATR